MANAGWQPLVTFRMNYINPKDDQVAPQFADIRDTSRRFVILLGALAVLALVGLLGARPTYRWFKNQRALAMVAQGEAAAATNDWTQVGRVVQTTLRLAPEELRVLRLAARYSSRQHLPAGLNYWQMVQAKQPLTLDDQFDFASLAVDLGRTDLSAHLLQQLVATNQIDPKVLRLVVVHSQAVGSMNEAINAARRWVSEAPGNEDAENALANLLYGRPSPAERREGRGLLWGLALGKSRFSTNAVEKLAASPELSQGENLVLLKQIESRPDQLVTSYVLRIKLNPNQMAELVNSMVKAVVEDGSVAQLAAAASWLADNKQTARVLDVLPMKLAEKNPVLMTGRLQALLELGELAEVKRFLELDTSKVEAFMLHCLRAYSAMKEGKPQLMAGHFENALAAAGGVPSRLRFVAGYAERIGQPTAAISAYKRLMSWPPATLDSAQNILRLASALNDTRTLRESTSQLSSYLPGDRGVAILDAYLGALLQDTSARAKANILRLLGDNPKESDATLALALIELRLGETQAALARLEKMPPSWVQSTPQNAAVYAAVLGANEQREAARRLARGVDVSKLRPEEAELIKEFRQ
jgi:tetratricopeptide (TPR) repeat protein